MLDILRHFRELSGKLLRTGPDREHASAKESAEAVAGELAPRARRRPFREIMATGAVAFGQIQHSYPPRFATLAKVGPC